MRRAAQNPRQFALSAGTLHHVDEAAQEIALHWRAAMLREPGRYIVPVYAIPTGETVRGLQLVVGASVINDTTFRADGGVDLESPVEGDGALSIQVFVNMARRLTEAQIREVLRHETLHVVFWAKARADKPLPVRAADLKTDEDWANYMYSESEYISRVLTFVHALEDELARLWKQDRRKAKLYAKELMSMPPTPIDLKIVIHANEGLVRRQDANALYYYADSEYYTGRFADAIRYSIEDKLAVLKKG